MGVVVQYMKQNKLLSRAHVIKLNCSVASTQYYYMLKIYIGCLQCLDAVGWAAGRASGL